MEDPNVIACLYPADDNQLAALAIQMRENGPESRTRESTASLGDNNNENKTPPPGLQITFKSKPRAGPGYMFGTDPNRCDIVLPKTARNLISRSHCYLTFDTSQRLILRDCSRHGTIVTYDGEGGETRRSTITYGSEGGGRGKPRFFDWILSGTEAGEINQIIIVIQEVSFRIVAPKHEDHLDLYTENVGRFLREANAEDGLGLGGLGLQSTTSTAHQSATRTPTPPQPPIYINRRRIGKGSFSIVYRAWDVSTGSIYAAKAFRPDTTDQSWRKEASIMERVSQLSNEHIVQFIGLAERPPRLILEYLPFGSLETQDRRRVITYNESTIILCQSLDALTSVHEAGVVHRDIKPENILVQSREPLRIKLSDFGLGKATDDLQTFCGTDPYAAPEIHAKRRAIYYTKACDIWSLAVVVLQCAFGPLPDVEKTGVGIAWCEEVIKWAHDWDDPDVLLDFLSAAMRPTPEGICRRGNVDSYINNDDEEEDIEDQGPPYQGAPGMRNIPEAKRKRNSPATWTSAQQKGKGRAHAEAGQRPRSTVRQEKRVRQEQDSVNTHHPISVDAKDMFVTKVAADFEDEAIQNRTLAEPGSDHIYVVIHGNAVAMHTVDYRLNATQICTAAGLDENSRSNYRRKLKSRSATTTIRGNLWAPFPDGVYLCRALGLFTEALPLLSQAPLAIPSDAGNYLTHRAPAPIRLPHGYKALDWDGKLIFYLPGTRRISVTHLLKLHDIHRNKLLKFWPQHDHIPRDVERFNPIQGTYIDLEDARTLCQHFGLSEGPIDEIMRLERVENAGTAEQEPDPSAVDHGAGPVMDATPYSPLSELGYDLGSFIAPTDEPFLKFLNET